MLFLSKMAIRGGEGSSAGFLELEATVAGQMLAILGLYSVSRDPLLSGVIGTAVAGALRIGWAGAKRVWGILDYAGLGEPK